MDWFIIAYLCSAVLIMTLRTEKLQKRLDNLEDRYYEILKEIHK